MFKKSYLNVYDIVYYLDEFNKKLQEETGFASWLNTKVDWKFVRIWDEMPLDWYDKGSSLRIRALFVLDCDMDLKLEVGNYIKNRITNKYITKEWLQNQFESFKPQLIQEIKKLDEKYKQQYKDKKFFIIKYDKKMGSLIGFNDKFYIVDSASLDNLVFDNVLMSFNMDDAMLSFFKDNKFKIDVIRSIDKYDVQEKISISFQLPLFKNVLDIISKMISIQNNFTKPIIHPDNWDLLKRVVSDIDGNIKDTFYFNDAFYKNTKLTDFKDYGCLDLKNGYMVLNDNYKHIVAWLNDIEERNKNKSLSYNELIDILKTSYKESKIEENKIEYNQIKKL